MAVTSAKGMADLLSAIQQGIPSSDETVHLVSNDGKKFAMHEQVLKGSSDFFKALSRAACRSQASIPSERERAKMHTESGGTNFMLITLYTYIREQANDFGLRPFGRQT